MVTGDGEINLEASSLSASLHSARKCYADVQGLNATLRIISDFLLFKLFTIFLGYDSFKKAQLSSASLSSEETVIFSATNKAV